MKQIIKFLSVAFGLVFLFAACDKVADLPYYANGNTPALSSSSNAIAPTPADSLNNVVTFSWTSPKYATDSSTVKYIVEIDSAGRNFSNAASRTVSGTLSTTYTGKELNDILVAFGFSFGIVRRNERAGQSWKNDEGDEFQGVY